MPEQNVAHVPEPRKARSRRCASGVPAYRLSADALEKLKVELDRLSLSDSASVRDFVARMRERHPHLIGGHS